MYEPGNPFGKNTNRKLSETEWKVIEEALSAPLREMITVLKENLNEPLSMEQIWGGLGHAPYDSINAMLQKKQIPFRLARMGPRTKGSNVYAFVYSEEGSAKNRKKIG